MKMNEGVQGSRRGGWRAGLLVLLALLVAAPAAAAAAAAAGWRAQGTAAYRAGDLAGALTAYTRGVVATPNDSVLWNNVAVLLWRLDEVGLAGRAATEAVILRPDYPEAERNRRLFTTLGGDGVTSQDRRIRFLAALLARRAHARVVVDGLVPARTATARLSSATPPVVAVAAESTQPVVEAWYRPAEPAMPVARALAVATGDPGGRVPAAILRLPPGAPDVLLVDKQAHCLYRFRGTADGPVAVASMPCVVGKRAGRKARRGDLRTPEGVYFLERHLDGEGLPPLYGAMAYPTDYPNSFDRLAGRDGGGIWLHGTDDPGRLATPDDSRGCVVVANADLEALSTAIRTRRTPLVVVPAITWLAPAQARARAEEVTTWLDGWRRDWQKGVWDRYRGRYADAFFRLSHTTAPRWLARKRALFAEEGRRRIEVREITVLAAAGQKVAIFDQGYRSLRHHDRGVKRVYLTGDGDGYRIVAERWIPIRPTADLATRAVGRLPRS